MFFVSRLEMLDREWFPEGVTRSSGSREKFSHCVRSSQNVGFNFWKSTDRIPLAASSTLHTYTHTYIHYLRGHNYITIYAKTRRLLEKWNVVYGFDSVRRYELNQRQQIIVCIYLGRIFNHQLRLCWYTGYCGVQWSNRHGKLKCPR